jgi:hypothetical protein
VTDKEGMVILRMQKCAQANNLRDQNSNVSLLGLEEKYLDFACPTTTLLLIIDYQ